MVSCGVTPRAPLFLNDQTVPTTDIYVFSHSSLPPYYPPLLGLCSSPQKINSMSDSGSDLSPPKHRGSAQSRRTFTADPSLSRSKSSPSELFSDAHDYAQTPHGSPLTSGAQGWCSVGSCRCRPLGSLRGRGNVPSVGSSLQRCSEGQGCLCRSRLYLFRGGGLRWFVFVWSICATTVVSVHGSPFLPVPPSVKHEEATLPCFELNP